MFETNHRLIAGDARRLASVSDGAVDLVVTSPPYPMIAMWDELFARMSPASAAALADGDGAAAFELMHAELDKVWAELVRVLKPGGLACINVGDAVRSLAGGFALYPNHARILSAAAPLGFQSLPCLIWRKQTNAPNKFMGSGMLPAGAYATLEHEYILVLRKGGRRRFESAQDKRRRRESAFFWEERNRWFSDLWDFKGARQNLAGVRPRSAAFPFELPFRLIAMHSCLGDLVLDPFLGTGTTSAAAILLGRCSIGVEFEAEFIEEMLAAFPRLVDPLNEAARRRLEEHIEFVRRLAGEKARPKYTNRPHGLPVVTAQETDLRLYGLEAIEAADGQTLVARHRPLGEFKSTLF